MTSSIGLPTAATVPQQIRKGYKWRKHTAEASNNWDDIGFRLEGNDHILWLNKFYISKQFNLTVQKENKEMIEPEFLMKEISERRDEFLNGLTIYEAS